MTQIAAIPEGFEPVVTSLPVTQRARRAPVRFSPISSTTILATDYPEIRWVVPGYVAEGLNLLVGRQKLGKTFMSMDWAVAVATGGFAMGGIVCEQGDVLYVDLENGPARVQRRLRAICPDADRVNLGRLVWQYEAIALNRGFIEALDHWCNSVPQARLVVIDVLQRVKPIGVAARNSYENDYAALSELQQWATRRGVAVVALMHTRKGGADDPLEAVNGSNGLAACADTTLILDKKSEGITLYVRGRDVEEKETALQFTGGLWTITGDAADVRRSVERSEVLGAFLTADALLSPGEIAIAVGKKRNAVDQLLYRMAKAGEITKVGRGFYRHNERADLALETPSKIGKKVRNDGEVPGY